MKIIILHGQDAEKSYDRLTKFINAAKARSWEIVTNEFPNTPSLFGLERLIIYRDYKLLSKRDIENFDKFDGTLVIYHDSDIPATFIKQLTKDAKIEKFDLPKLLFTFLESLYPGNSNHAIKLLHEVTKTEPIELVMFFIAKYFRDLYLVNLTGGTPVNTGVPAWKFSKLKKQSDGFSVQRLQQFIGLLSDIDIKVKSSKSDLLTELDLLIVKQLE